MSANNYILVKQNKNGFSVSMRDDETGALIGKIENYKRLIKALRRAQRIVDKDVVEYGIMFQAKEKK